MRTPLELLYNFHWIVPGEAARSAQAFAGFLPSLLSDHAIRGLINLRGYDPTEGWWLYEQRVCDECGVVRLDAMLDSRKLPTPTMIVSLLDAFDTAPKPFLIKCAGGQDRTGFAAALYILHRRGWEAREQAMSHFSAMRYRHFPKREQKWLKEFPGFAESHAGSAPLSIWARESYDPLVFASWLEERGLGGSFSGVFLAEHERIRLG
jgi:protein tyrosine/serine phosphatase